MLPHREDRMILSSFVWIGYQRMTDRQTDKRMELPWLIQRSALQAMWPRWKMLNKRCKWDISGHIWISMWREISGQFAQMLRNLSFFLCIIVCWAEGSSLLLDIRSSSYCYRVRNSSDYDLEWLPTMSRKFSRNRQSSECRYSWAISFGFCPMLFANLPAWQASGRSISLAQSSFKPNLAAKWISVGSSKSLSTAHT